MTPPPETAARDPKRRTAKTVLFADYAQDWLKLKEQTTKPSTFKEYSRMFEANLRPTFGHLHLAEITRPLVQQYLFTFVEAGKHRTAEKLALMLNCIFDMAAEDFGLPSPMKKVVLPAYQTKRGQALSKEEARLVNCCKTHKEVEGTDALLVLLYFGLRKSELKSIFEGIHPCRSVESELRSVTKIRPLNSGLKTKIYFPLPNGGQFGIS